MVVHLHRLSLTSWQTWFHICKAGTSRLPFYAWSQADYFNVGNLHGPPNLRGGMLFKTYHPIPLQEVNPPERFRGFHRNSSQPLWRW